MEMIRSVSEIEKEIVDKQDEVFELVIKWRRLRNRVDQTKLGDKITRLHGEINALKWVIYKQT